MSGFRVSNREPEVYSKVAESVCMHYTRQRWMAAPMCQKQGNPVAAFDVTKAWDVLSPVYTDNRMNQVKN